MACHAGQADPVQPEALDRKLWNRFSLGSLLPSFSLPSFSGCFSFFFQTRTRRTRRTRTGLDELNSYIPVIFLYSLDGLVIDTLFLLADERPMALMNRRRLTRGPSPTRWSTPPKRRPTPRPATRCPWPLFVLFYRVLPSFSFSRLTFRLDSINACLYYRFEPRFTCDVLVFNRILFLLIVLELVFLPSFTEFCSTIPRFFSALIRFINFLMSKSNFFSIFSSLMQFF